jgi:putative transposase
MERKFKKTPPRLPQIFDAYAAPLYLVTLCTVLRRPLLACPQVHAGFRQYADRGRQFNVAVGRYVIMPDHLHAFVCFGGDVSLGRWTKGLKHHLDVTLESLGHSPVSVGDSKLTSFWQPGVFDHLLRHDESYAQKWNYVWQNPVRAGLVARPENWPYQGEIVVIDRV